MVVSISFCRFWSALMDSAISLNCLRRSVMICACSVSFDWACSMPADSSSILRSFSSCRAAMPAIPDLIVALSLRILRISFLPRSICLE